MKLGFAAFGDCQRAILTFIAMMNASDAIRELQSLMKEHGDLPLTVALLTGEYSLREPQFVDAGPCDNIADRQNQSPPDRFVFEGKDDIPNSD